MHLFAIRDDDTSFFTQPEELDRVYGDYWGHIPISLAVVPFSVARHKEKKLAREADGRSLHSLADNERLVRYLREKVRLGCIEILLHGYSHEYKNMNGRWVGEFAWKKGDRLVREVLHGKSYLQDLLGARVAVFVPPGNAIRSDGVKALRAAGLNLSGILGRGGDRPVTSDYLSAYVRRWTFRAWKGRPYPWPLTYGGHTELVANSLTPPTTIASLQESLAFAFNLNAPFVLATHYWEFAESPSMGDRLRDLIKTARIRGARFVPISTCLTV